MTVTLTFGWWLAPFAVTCIFFLWAWFVTPPAKQSYGYGQAAGGFIDAVMYGIALIASLIAWLIWALLT